MLSFLLQYGRLLQLADPTVILVMLICYSFATISLCFLISVFFSRANLAAACGGIIFFILFLPYPVVAVNFADVLSLPQKLASVDKFL